MMHYQHESETGISCSLLTILHFTLVSDPDFVADSQQEDSFTDGLASSILSKRIKENSVSTPDHSYPRLAESTKVFAWLGVAISGALLAASPTISVFDSSILADVQSIISQQIAVSVTTPFPFDTLVSDSVSFMTQNMQPSADLSEWMTSVSIMATERFQDAAFQLQQATNNHPIDWHALNNWNQFFTVSESAKEYHLQNLGALPTPLQHPQETMEHWSSDFGTFVGSKVDQVRAFLPKAQDSLKGTISSFSAASLKHDLVVKFELIQSATAKTLESLSALIKSEGETLTDSVVTVRSALEQQQAELPAKYEDFQALLLNTQEQAAKQFTLTFQESSQRLDEIRGMSARELQAYANAVPGYVEQAKADSTQSISDLSLMAQSLSSQIQSTTQTMEPVVKDYAAAAQSLSSKIGQSSQSTLNSFVKAAQDIRLSEVVTKELKPHEFQLLSLDDMKQYLQDTSKSISSLPPSSMVTTPQDTNIMVSTNAAAVVEPVNAVNAMANFDDTIKPTTFVSYPDPAFLPEKVHAATHISPPRFDVSAKDLNSLQLERLESSLFSSFK
jgi:hypothetical protein